MPVPTCPRDSKGKNITCSSQYATIYCQSLHKGHFQDCTPPDAAGGWLECIDVTPQCDINNYWINKDQIWVKDGCGGRIDACYSRDIPTTQLRSRTMECRHWNTAYKVCKVEKARKVQSVKKVAQFPITSEFKCTKGINFGIIQDSIWIKDGCNGIYDVEYYSDSHQVLPVPTSPTIPHTSQFPGGNFHNKNNTTIRTNSVRSTLHNSGPSVTTATGVNPETVTPPGTMWSDGLMGITVGVLCGAFLMLLLTIVAILWFARRRRILDKEKKAKQTYQRDEPFVDDGRHYEEIHPRENSVRYEAEPFIPSPTSFPGPKPMNGSFSEQNNNPSNGRPPLGENYFILEPSTGRPLTPSETMVAVRSHPGIQGFIPYVPGHHYVLQQSPHHPAIQSQQPTIPPAHLIPLREKYIIPDSSQQRQPEIPPPGSRYPERNNTIGHCNISTFNQSPVEFCADPPSYFSLGRRQNEINKSDNKTTSVSSQTELPETDGDEGYDKIEDFRQMARTPSEKSHQYDQVQLTDSPSQDSQYKSESTKSSSRDSSTC